MYIEDLTGRRFGRLTVIGPSKELTFKDGTKSTYWLCKCECGEKGYFSHTDLTREDGSLILSCGCISHFSSNRDPDFRVRNCGVGWWRIDDCDPIKTDCGNLWRCTCICGKKDMILEDRLLSGMSQSCGCKKNPVLDYRTSRLGKSARLRGIWSSMILRCTDPKSPAYKHYGARGIYVCDEWMRSFESFRDWALAHGYTNKVTIDRIDNDGPYHPANCRWVDRISQANNTRRNVYVTLDGETRTLQRWSRVLGVSSPTLSRWVRDGRSEEWILTRAEELRKKREGV